MTERKKLSLSSKRATSTSDGSENGTTGIRGGKKRIVIAKPEKPEQPTQKKRKKPKKAPSILRVNVLDAELSKLSKCWRSHKPLALGIEKQIFKAVADGKLSASKRVVRALLDKHCTNPNYLRNTVSGPRYNLTDSESGQVVASEAAYALKRLRALND